MSTPDDTVLTHCTACGRRFGRRARLTIARWFDCGAPPDCAIVHVGCLDSPRPGSPRAKQLSRQRAAAAARLAARRAV